MGVLWSMKACSSLCTKSAMSLKCNFVRSKLQWWKCKLSNRQTQSNSKRISISRLSLECVMVHEAPRAIELKKLASCRGMSLDMELKHVLWNPVILPNYLYTLYADWNLMCTDGQICFVTCLKHHLYQTLIYMWKYTMLLAP
jgi:hypothetical protein